MMMRHNLSSSRWRSASLKSIALRTALTLLGIGGVFSASIAWGQEDAVQNEIAQPLVVQEAVVIQQLMVQPAQVVAPPVEGHVVFGFQEFDGQDQVFMQPLLPAVPSKEMVVTSIRGLIQSELSLVDELCALNPEQQQQLADTAEEQWHAKTNVTIKKATAQHIAGSIDIEGLVERSMRVWLMGIATPEQLEKYDAELEDRARWRREAVISKLLDVLATKLQLSGGQLVQVEEILRKEYKDRWFTSIEGIYTNDSRLPEVRPNWIRHLLNEAQRNALASRNTSITYSSFQSSPAWPYLESQKRFVVGKATSSESIELAIEPPDNDVNLAVPRMVLPRQLNVQP